MKKYSKKLIINPKKMVQKKKANINITVELDENKIPEKLIWSAPDGGVKNKISKAIFLSIWDHKNRESLSIDLWTKEMPIDEMNEFFYQSLLTMGEAFYRATENIKIKDAIKKFSQSIKEDLNVNRNSNKNL